jgi:HK97 family phage prohead protease
MKPEKEVRLIAAPNLRVDVSGGKSPRVSGHAAVFDSMSEDLGFREVVRPGAFKRSLERGADVVLLVNHDGLPLARTRSGTLKLSEDKRGLYFEATLDPSDPDVQQIVPKLNRGDLSQMSFAFRVPKGGDSWRTEGGTEVRELIEVDIDHGDVSLVTHPAYVSTDVALRSREAWKNGVPAYDNLRLRKYRTL